jgi:phosphate transport system substrate-binding protein
MRIVSMAWTRNLIAASVFALGVAGTAGVAQTGEGTRPGESTDGLDLQDARARMMTERGQRIAYTKDFDLSGLPDYQPKRVISGTLRMWGSNYITDGMVGGFWEDAFRKYHPNVRFEWNMKTTSAAVPSLVFGVSDIGMGRKVTFSELQMFQRYKDRDPLEIEIATGSFNVPGWQPGYGVVVNKDNPIHSITMDQLDGIFGAERAGGWDGTSWRPDRARGPEKNIRTWGELGLGGEWADKPIHVYGLNLRYHQAIEISDMVLQSSDKWNESLRIYANYVTADGKLARNMNQDLASDKYGIGIVAAPTTTLGGGGAVSAQKVLPVARTADGPFVPYTLETLQDRSYPMHDEIYAYADPDPANGANPNVVELLRFIVSRQGQELVKKDAKYLPLTAEVSKAQMDKLDALLP